MLFSTLLAQYSFLSIIFRLKRSVLPGKRFKILVTYFSDVIKECSRQVQVKIKGEHNGLWIMNLFNSSVERFSAGIVLCLLTDNSAWWKIPQCQLVLQIYVRTVIIKYYKTHVFVFCDSVHLFQVV